MTEIGWKGKDLKILESNGIYSSSFSFHWGFNGAVVSRLDYCAGDLGSIPAGAEFPTGIKFWVMT